MSVITIMSYNIDIYIILIDEVIITDNMVIYI